MTYLMDCVGTIVNSPSRATRRLRRQLIICAGALGWKLARGIQVEMVRDVQVDVIVKVAVWG